MFVIQTKSTPIFRKILIPLMILVVMEISLMVFSLFGQGLLGQLRENERDVLAGRVEARKNYLESVMLNDWTNVSPTVKSVVDQTQKLINREIISLDTLDDSSANCEQLMSDCAPHLIEMMRNNHVSGAYIIINTDDLSDGGIKNVKSKEKPGIYLYDADPTSMPSERNEDILIKISPQGVVKNLHIATDVNWDVQFRIGDAYKSDDDYYYFPYQAAFEGRASHWKNIGYWTVTSGQLSDSKAPVLSYSVPLVLDDGTVFGTLGVNLSEKYLSKLLPADELGDDGVGGYFIALYHPKEGEFSHVLGFGDTSGLTEGENGRFTVNTQTHYVSMAPLHLYNSNVPFTSHRWVVVGSLPHQAMLSFVRKMVIATLIAVVIALVMGVFFSLLISYRLQRPVVRLVQDIRAKDTRQNIKLTTTGIQEIDQMANAIMNLSKDVMESGRKFSEIISMASVHLAGYEIDQEKNTLFLTEDFFSIFGMEDVSQAGMGVEQFNKVMQSLREYELKDETLSDGYILRIPMDGNHRFVRLRIMNNDGHIYGLAEDVTQSVREKQIIEYERDHDSLTNLYNRRAFRRKIQSILDNKEKPIACGALLMLDTDNLKYINDTYGHEYGDRYLKHMAEAITRFETKNVCRARISGDEFNVFLYGYGDRQEIEAKIQRLKKEINSSILMLPNGKTQPVRASGGVAWYPQDSTSFDNLSKYADYAMYRAKRNTKGEFQVFNKDIFETQDLQLRNSDALTRMIDQHLLYFAFQPIVDAHTGAVFAHEMLMRPDVGKFFSVGDALDAARRGGMLSQIEELTWYVGLQNFEEQIQAGRIAPDSCLFVNSIPTQRMPEEKEYELLERYSSYGKQIVIELTEDERLDLDIWEDKVRKHKAVGGRIALDDYGAGYNSEKALIALSPDFIKVDLSIVRDIHLNADKQAIMEYIVGFAHARGKKVIAEGVETEDEVRAILELGADYMQGYFFAKPQRNPQGIAQEALKLLQELSETL